MNFSPAAQTVNCFKEPPAHSQITHGRREQLTNECQGFRVSIPNRQDLMIDWETMAIVSSTLDPLRNPQSAS
jgi:hypothetical protein